MSSDQKESNSFTIMAIHSPTGEPSSNLCLQPTDVAFTPSVLEGYLRSYPLTGDDLPHMLIPTRELMHARGRM